MLPGVGSGVDGHDLARQGVAEQLQQAQAHEARADEHDPITGVDLRATNRLDHAAERLAERSLGAEAGGYHNGVSLFGNREFAQRRVDASGDDVTDRDALDAGAQRNDLADRLVAEPNLRVGRVPVRQVTCADAIDQHPDEQLPDPDVRHGFGRYQRRPRADDLADPVARSAGHYGAATASLGLSSSTAVPMMCCSIMVRTGSARPARITSSNSRCSAGISSMARCRGESR